MLIMCTMREGITEADIEGYRYTFKPDQNGNPIASVTKESHIKVLLNMGPHCYKEFRPEIPVEQMSADEILALPDGVCEEEKKEIMRKRNEAELEKRQAAARAAAAPAKSKMPEKKEEKEETEPEPAPVVTQSAAAALAEAKIAEIINSFKTLSKKRFRGWLDANHDQIATMPEDVKIELAKKIKKNWPELDPEIPGLDLEKYGKPSTNTTDKGHSNNVA